MKKTKIYKHYLVDNFSDDNGWTYGVFQDYETALSFCKNLTLPDLPVLGIVGTDEDPDVCMSLETVYIYDTASGKSIPTDTTVRNYRLAERIHKTEARLCSPGRENEDISSMPDLVKSLKTVNGCLSVIEYLLDNIEVME